MLFESLLIICLANSIIFNKSIISSIIVLLSMNKFNLFVIAIFGSGIISDLICMFVLVSAIYAIIYNIYIFILSIKNSIIYENN